MDIYSRKRSELFKEHRESMLKYWFEEVRPVTARCLEKLFNLDELNGNKPDLKSLMNGLQKIDSEKRELILSIYKMYLQIDKAVKDLNVENPILTGFVHVKVPLMSKFWDREDSEEINYFILSGLLKSYVYAYPKHKLKTY